MNDRARRMMLLGGLMAALDAGRSRGKHSRRPKNYSSAKARKHARMRRALAKVGRKVARRSKR